MALTPSTTDKFTKVGLPGTATTLDSPGYNIDDSDITVISTTNWPTDTKAYFAMDRAEIVNGVEQRVPNSYCEFSGIVSGATGITDLNIEYGTPQNYPAGSLTRVYIPVSASRENALIDGLNQDHNGKGNHKTLTDDNGNEWLERGETASAVNQLKATNSATGHNPVLSASGDDTDRGVSIQSKGAGVSDIDGAAPKPFIQKAMFNFIESGCVWTPDAAGSTLKASMTAGVVWIAGKRLTVAAVTAHTLTASKDTYIDFQDNGDGTASVTYTEATNNAASVAIPNSKNEANNIRNGIIVSGASNIANAASINQGQESALLPIASSTPYAVTDSLGYLICPRDPNRKLLGLRRITSVFVNPSVGANQVTGLSAPIYLPDSALGRKIKISFSAADVLFGNDTVVVSLWDGVVGSGTELSTSAASLAASVRMPAASTAIQTVMTNSKVYNVGFLGNAAQLDAASGYPAILMIELE